MNAYMGMSANTFITIIGIYAYTGIYYIGISFMHIRHFSYIGINVNIGMNVYIIIYDMGIYATVGIHACIEVYAYIGKMPIMGINDMPIS